MHSNSVNLDLTNLKKILKETKKNYVVKVGILGSKDSRDKGSNASIGLTHEIGSASNNIPARSFLNMPLNEKLPNEISEIGQDVIDGLTKDNIEGLYKKLGVKAEGIIQDAFDTGGFGKWEKLSDITIANKGFDKKLIDSTQLRKSVTSEVIK